MKKINPQERYQNPMTTRRLSNGKVVYNSLLPKGYRENPTKDVILTATDVLRMDKMANDVYGSAMNWWRIAAANKKVNGSLYFRPGNDIIIPTE